MKIRQRCFERRLRISVNDPHLHPAVRRSSGYSLPMLTELFDEIGPPDPDLVDLIELAFLEGQIDGGTLSLACVWLERNHASTQ